MQWPRLLSRKRLGTDQAPSRSAARTEFQRDFDRIVFSSAFRRLQDKTQVFPLSKVDYVRTRLTHSLESSSVGRSLGTLVGEQVIARHALADYAPSDFGDIVAAACLGHDIGNPPFGHSGEDAIRHWARTGTYGRPRVATLRGSQQEDFLSFEGNAQGFRVLTRLQNRDNPGGLQLTCATLAAFTKYPRESCLGGNRYDGVSARKQGFTAEDRAAFEEVAETVGLLRRHNSYAIWRRHPLAFLVEAADDICYHVIDIEDGYRLGRLSYAEAQALFWPLVADPQREGGRLEKIGGTREKVEFLRAKVINHVIQQVVAVFLDLEGELLAGRHDAPLLDAIPGAAAMQTLIDVANERIYCAPEVVEIETAGFQVIGDLLERFVEAVDDLAEHGPDAMPRSRMMIRLIPEQFVGPRLVPAPDLYGRLLRLTDFMAGMTDSYAVSLYKKVTGIALPGG